jgi:hypothetical protein
MYRWSWAGQLFGWFSIVSTFINDRWRITSLDESTPKKLKEVTNLGARKNYSSLSSKVIRQVDIASDFGASSIESWYPITPDELSTTAVEIPIDLCAAKIHSSLGFETRK